MRTRAARQVLRDIAAIRGLQFVAAEAAAAAAARELRARKTELEESERECLTAERSWQSALTASSVALDVLGSWSARLLEADAVRERAEESVGRTTAASAHSSAARFAALARRDAAHAAVRREARRAAIRRDDKRLEEMLDRFAAGGRRP